MAPGTTTTEGELPAEMRAGPLQGDPESVRDEIGELLKGIGSQMRVHFMAHVGAARLTPPQAIALLNLTEPMTMGSLAASLGLDASYITGIADQLEAKGLIERRPDPGDRRRKILAMTVAGERIQDNLLDAMRRSHDAAIGGLTDGERVELRNLLVKVMAALEGSLPDGELVPAPT